MKKQETRDERLDRRDADVIAKYDELKAKKVHHTRLYTHEAVVAMVGHQFYLSVYSINNIVNENQPRQRRQKNENDG